MTKWTELGGFPVVKVERDEHDITLTQVRHLFDGNTCAYWRESISETVPVERERSVRLPLEHSNNLHDVSRQGLRQHHGHDLVFRQREPTFNCRCAARRRRLGHLERARDRYDANVRRFGNAAGDTIRRNVERVLFQGTTGWTTTMACGTRSARPCGARTSTASTSSTGPRSWTTSSTWPGPSTCRTTRPWTSPPTWRTRCRTSPGTQGSTRLLSWGGAWGRQGSPRRRSRYLRSPPAPWRVLYGALFVSAPHEDVDGEAVQERVLWCIHGVPRGYPEHGPRPAMGLHFEFRELRDGERGQVRCVQEQRRRRQRWNVSKVFCERNFSSMENVCAKIPSRALALSCELSLVLRRIFLERSSCDKTNNVFDWQSCKIFQTTSSRGCVVTTIRVTDSKHVLAHL